MHSVLLEYQHCLILSFLSFPDFSSESNQFLSFYFSFPPVYHCSLFSSPWFPPVPLFAFFCSSYVLSPFFLYTLSLFILFLSFYSIIVFFFLPFIFIPYSLMYQFLFHLLSFSPSLVSHFVIIPFPLLTLSFPLPFNSYPVSFPFPLHVILFFTFRSFLISRHPYLALSLPCLSIYTAAKHAQP